MFLIQPYRVLEILNKSNSTRLVNEKIENLIKEMDETSNPLLMFAKLKSF